MIRVIFECIDGLRSLGETECDIPSNVLRHRFASTVSLIYIPLTAVLGTTQSCDTWIAEHRKGGGGAKCVARTMARCVDIPLSAI